MRKKHLISPCPYIANNNYYLYDYNSLRISLTLSRNLLLGNFQRKWSGDAKVE
ncbi:MAG: hypothetical protein ACRC2T_04790 [Thermoguttaceae bacterium]